MTEKLTLGFSTCPNDTFMFGAMVEGRIDTEGIEFECSMADVEDLNRRAFGRELDITKLSYHAYAYCQDHYRLLTSGSAMGRGCGPLLISRRPLTPQQLSSCRIAIPGLYTTAHFLLRYFLGDGLRTTPLIFSSIEQAILDGSVDAGVIIHESRFTYEAKGLTRLKDLGEYWESRTRLPIPLGAIVIGQNLGDHLAERVNRVLRRSIQFAFDHPDSVMPFVNEHAQAMDPAVMRAHIELYVNSFSLDLGPEGLLAVERFLEEVKRNKLGDPLQSA